MYWQNDKPKPKVHVGDEVIDLVFGLNCRCLPVDHVYALSRAIQSVLPWLEDEPMAGLHAINVAASGNGWMRPDGPGELLHLSRRTRLELRVPAHRVDDAKALQGVKLEIDGNEMQIKSATERHLSTITTLFTRAFATEPDIADEAEALDWVAARLHELDIVPRKMLCGTEHFIATADVPIRTRSLMIADLEVEESLRLQQRGLGPYRHLGCGLFIPHKDINDLREEKE